MYVMTNLSGTYPSLAMKRWHVRSLEPIRESTKWILPILG